MTRRNPGHPRPIPATERHSTTPRGEHAMSTTIYRRYVNDPSTSEVELHERSGQPVTLVGEPFEADPVEPIWMQRIRFADGFEAEAFIDELSPEPKVPHEHDWADGICHFPYCDERFDR